MAASTRRGAITQRSAVIAKRWMMLAASPEPGARISAERRRIRHGLPQHGCGGSEDGGQQRVDLRRPQECALPRRAVLEGDAADVHADDQARREPCCRDVQERAAARDDERRGDPAPLRKVRRRRRARDRARSVREAGGQPGGPLGHPHQQAM